MVRKKKNNNNCQQKYDSCKLFFFLSILSVARLIIVFLRSYFFFLSYKHCFDCFTPHLKVERIFRPTVKNENKFIFWVYGVNRLCEG